MSTWYQTHPFSKIPLTSTCALPALSIIALDNLSLITAKGEETISYLQGQLTCDLVSLAKDEFTHAAHCDAKGKIWSSIRIFHHLDGVAYTLPQSVVDIEFAEIKKYAVFSKVIFEKSDTILLGLAGEKAGKTINLRFPGAGRVRTTKTGSALHVGADRWLLAISPDEANDMINELSNKAVLSDHTLWQLYELRDGIPTIEAATSNSHIPQAINLQYLDAISFKKGCYTGQETVARAKYRGINKRAAYLLAGSTNNPIQAGDTFERSVGENWRTGGTTLYGYRFDDGQALALVVLPNNLEDDALFRRTDETEEYWKKQALPYAFDEHE